jgi:hypothetical protein
MYYYYINLIRSPERAAAMETLLAARPHERVEAVDGKLWDGTGWKKQGRAKEHYWRGTAGCWFSHVRALERALDNDVFPCCILEDDITFASEPVMPETGDIVYFGGTDLPAGVYGTFAIAYRNREAATRYLQWLRTHRTSADGAAVAFQKRTQAITYCRPWSIIHAPGWSFIRERTLAA